jgi:heme-degrading monooxygenase HmoA
MSELGLDRMGAKWPDGVLGHTAGKTADGWCVVDIWESETAFAKFQESRLAEVFTKVGIPEPKVTTFQVHNRYSAG